MAELQGTLFQECSHPHKVVVPEKRGPHHARLICKHCKKFFGWIPSPENVRRQKENAQILTALSKLEKLPPWERQFVRSLSGAKHLSPKQQSTLEQMRDVFLRQKDGVWGIKQEYFDKVYTQQERKKINDGFNGVPMPPN